MRNKTLVRVVTLLLVALMVLTTFAPAFTAYAAEVLTIADHSSKVTIVDGTPDSETFSSGTYVFTLSEDGRKLYARNSDSETVAEADVTTNPESQIRSAIIGGLNLCETSAGDWNNATFTITFRIATSDDEPILSYASVNDSRIRRGESVTLNATVIDPNFKYSDISSKEIDKYVIFEQGDFRRGSNAPYERVNVGPSGSDELLGFTIEMNELIYTGTGNTIQFALVYVIDGTRYSHDFTVRVDGCVPYVDSGNDNTDDDDEDVELDPLTPHIIVSQYDYGDAQVSAGNTIDLALTISNTSRHYDLDNIVMKITTGDGFAITSSSNTYYFDSLNVNENITKTISLQASPSAEAQSYPINIEFSFQYIANDKRVSGTSSESISIPVTQLDRFSVNEIQTPTSIYVGDEYEVSVNFVNLGKNVVYNVTAQLEGNMQNSGERNFIGNVASGTEDSADFYITPTQAGTIEGQIVISYEDSNMNVKQVSKPFTIQVDEYPVYDTGFDDMPVIDPVPQEPESPFTLQNILLFRVFAGVTGATGYMTVLRIKAKRSEFDDEDL